MAGVKMVLYWHLPLFAAMKVVHRVIKTLKDSGTTQQMSDEIFTYDDYAEVLKLGKWLEIDEKYGS